MTIWKKIILEVVFPHIVQMCLMVTGPYEGQKMFFMLKVNLKVIFLALISGYLET